MEINLNGQSFDGEVIKADVPVLVDFWAPWCGPCQMVGPVISEIAEEYDGKIKVCKVNVDEAAEIASQNAIVSIPTVVLFKDGKAVERIIGANSFDDYADMIEKYI